MFEAIVSAPQFIGWWTFVYDGKPRIALVTHTDAVRGVVQTVTPDGVRSFKPGKMFGIRDVTSLTTC